jgi:hypothetical protein
MRAYRDRVFTENDDDEYATLDYGVEVEFDQYSCVSHHDWNLIEGKLGYVKSIQEIMQVYFSSFQCVILRCKQWDTFN